MDMQMPVMDGLKATQVLLPKLPDCQRALRSEWAAEVAGRRGLTLES